MEIPPTVLQKVIESVGGVQQDTQNLSITEGPSKVWFIRSSDKSLVLKKIKDRGSGNEKELKMYQHFIKELQFPPALQRKFPHADLPVLFPSCHLAHVQSDGEGFLFLEDLKCQGYQEKLNITAGLDFSHGLLALETLARFHAFSYHIKRQIGKMELLRRFPYIKETIFIPHRSGELSNEYSSRFNLACKIIEAENPSLAFNLQRKIQSSGIFDRIITLLEKGKIDNEEFFVFCHGDFYQKNLFFKYSGNEPVSCKMIDLQSSRYASLVSDLSYFFSTCFTWRIRQEFEEKLVAHYCDTFEEQLVTHLGVPKDEFDIEEFHRRVEEQLNQMTEYGFLTAIFSLPVYLTGLTNDTNCTEDYANTLSIKASQNAELRNRLLSLANLLAKKKII